MIKNTGVLGVSGPFPQCLFVMKNMDNPKKSRMRSLIPLNFEGAKVVNKT